MNQGNHAEILMFELLLNLQAGEYTMDKESVGMVLEILSLLRNVLHADDVRPGSTNGDAIIK